MATLRRTHTVGGMTKHRIRIIVTATALLLSVLSFASAKADPKPKTEKGPDRTLTVTLDGTGTVTSDPAGINCPQTCSAAFKRKTVVTLAATPNAGAIFGHWTAAGCDTSTTCTVTLDDTASVTATFYAGTAGCGSSAQTAHSDGLGQTFYDCLPLGVPGSPPTYSQTLAVEAAVAWLSAGGGGSTDSGSCGGVYGSYVIADRADGLEALWHYSGVYTGYVTNPQPVVGCLDPGGTWG